ncbi:MAG: exodeoxyribonuclease alpha subunit [Actinotalea sp.]|nr:exodeoxyribonuclease alpha subunit [Actinotalea sp.]
MSITTPRGFDVRLALRATPLLASFNAAEILVAADVHVAQRLARLTGESDERVMLAVALAVRAVRTGSVCIELDDASTLAVADAEDPVSPTLPWPDLHGWRAAIEASPMVALGVDGAVDRPVRWVGGRLYLDRYWRHEQVVRREVEARLLGPGFEVDHRALAASVHRLFPGERDSRQRLAAAACALSRLTVLTGGPGTGKTTTVARLLAVLQDVAGPGLRVALAAPTGKAAARLEEAIGEVVGTMAPDDAARVGTWSASTLHRLLGWRSATRFRHDRDHHLPHDVVIVDETSMVSLPLMAQLLEAMRPEARLLLVGDPDQLASVEAGAVLGDLVQRDPVTDRLPGALAAVVPEDLPTEEPDRRALRNGVIELTEAHRYDEVIGGLAQAIRGEPDAATGGRTASGERVLDLLRARSAEIEFIEVGEHLREADLGGLRADVVATGTALVEAARAGDAVEALRALEEHRLLLAHRRGPAGVAHWAERVESWVLAATGGPDRPHGWYAGQPLLVTANDRDTGLFNGDTGVVVSDGADGLVVAFGDPGRPDGVRRHRLHRLPAVQPVHAMTVHRGQGSQFRRVTVLLPPASSPLLTRELLYTAVTRARVAVRVIGTEEAVRAAVRRPIRRSSGLRDPLPGAS